MIPEIVGLCIYHHIPISRCGTADNCFYSPVMKPNLSNQFSLQDIYNDFMVKIVCTMGLSVWARFPMDLKCTRSQFSLSVFKCCLALLILSGKLEHKSSKSSFILMSQVLDLLRNEYWNGLELATFNGPRIHSACGADLGWGNYFFPPRRPDASPALFFYTFFLFGGEHSLSVVTLSNPARSLTRVLC